MGSGCASGAGLTSNILRPTPDTQVTYTGPAIPALGICTGDLLSEVEAAILSKILDFSRGIGIEIPDIDLTACALFTNDITCCNGPGTVPKDLDGLMIIIFTALCTLYTDFTTLQTLVNNLLNGPYNIGCLTLGSNPTLNQIIQELITEFCALKVRVTTLETTVAGISSNLNTNIGNFLNNAITSCNTDAVVKSGTGSSFTLQLKGQNPIGAVIMFSISAGGKLSWFDSTGKGYSNQPACGWALCNGNNATVDMRGFVPVGVNDTTMGNGAQDDSVNNSIHPGQAYGFNSMTGAIAITLSPSQVPPVGITVTSTSSCSIPTLYPMSYRPGDQNNGVSFTDTKQPPVDLPINCTTTLTGTTSGGDSAHENRQPSKGIYFIQRIS